jgi:hypothetical protein
MTERPTTPRWRLVLFWVTAVPLVMLVLGPAGPRALLYPVLSFGDMGDLASHEIHTFAQGVLAWVIIAAIAVNVRDAAGRAAAVWILALITTPLVGLYAALADIDALLPILVAAVVFTVIAFLAHPASLRVKLSSHHGPSLLMLALAAIAAIPLILYAVDQVGIHTSSGPGDEHYEFGHWIRMAAYASASLGIALVASLRVRGWRVPAWIAGLMIGVLGAASLGMRAASELPTVWAVLAIAWGAAFIGGAELEARRSTQRPVTATAQVEPTA